MRTNFRSFMRGLYPCCGAVNVNISGVSFLSPSIPGLVDQVRTRRASRVYRRLTQRQTVLDAALVVHPEWFVRGQPKVRHGYYRFCGGGDEIKVRAELMSKSDCTGGKVGDITSPKKGASMSGGWTSASLEYTNAAFHLNFR